MADIMFKDKLMPYESFVKDVAARLVRYIKSDDADPEYISQRKAFEMFGRCNIERWKRQKKVSYHKCPGKILYRMADLRLLQRTETEDGIDEKHKY